MIEPNVVLAAFRARGWTIASAESCTGGLVMAHLTDVPGSSDVVDRGFVTYSNAAKSQLLGVSEDTLASFGAVSEETAAEMAEGALALSEAHVAVSVTGVAGPGGGSAEKPVGLVCFGVAERDKPVVTTSELFGPIGRYSIRMRSVDKALRLALARAEAPAAPKATPKKTQPTEPKPKDTPAPAPDQDDDTALDP